MFQPPLRRKAADRPFSSLDFSWRVLLLLGLLLLETAAILQRFTFHLADDLTTGGPATRFFNQVGTFKTPLVLMALCALLAIAPRLGRIGADIRRRPARDWFYPLLGHGFAMAAFGLASSHIAAGLQDTAEVSPALLLAWLVSGGLAFCCWLAAVSPAQTWWQLARREYPALSAGVLAGWAIWYCGPLAQSFWESFDLAELTFRLSHGILEIAYPDVIYDTENRVLGTPEYQVKIMPVCSGLEGIFLISGFLAVYLWAFRKTLRFPNALCLFPLGILTIWLANTLRIAVLVAVGSSVSAEIASEGFHSQAGWISFTLIAFGLIFLAHRLAFFKAGQVAKPVPPTASGQATAYLAPFLALLAASMATSAFSGGFEGLYPVKTIAVAAVLYRFRGVYARLDWRRCHEGLPVGVLVFAVWLWLEPPAGPEADALRDDIAEWPGGLAAGWLAFRVTGSVLAVPLAEELAFRGYLLRKLVRPDFERVPVGRFTWFSFLASSLLFGLLHGRWLAGTLAGMAFAVAVYRRGRLADAIVAHATANALIATWVLGFGQWGLWT